MHFETAAAFRMSLEQRILDESRRSGLALDRLRRRVIYERIVVRFTTAEPGLWVIKGGIALDVRLGDQARTTKDLDLGLREARIDADVLRDRIIMALDTDPDDDYFVFTVGKLQELGTDLSDRATWRCSINGALAGRQFAGIKLDISPRIEELEQTEVVSLHNTLDFAGVDIRSVEIIDINCHAAEKFHALTQNYGDRSNTRVRDLVDLVLFLENDLLSVEGVRSAIIQTFTSRGTHKIPKTIADPPFAWGQGFTQIAADLDLAATDLSEAIHLVRSWWEHLGIETD